MEAEQQGDTVAVWKYTRLLAGTGRGPRNRAYNVPAADVPHTEERETYLEQSGPKGGCEGRRVECTEEAQTTLQWPDFAC